MQPRSALVRVVGVIAILLGTTVAGWAQDTGRLEGRIVRTDGAGVAGATIVLGDGIVPEITGPEGAFVFSGLPPGTYTVVVALGPNQRTITGVTVAAGATAEVEEAVDWDTGFTESLIVQATSRRLERIVDAPAAATRIGEAEIAAGTTHGQLPKLLEFAPGAEPTQSGIYDFNFNTRGFNSSLNRRIAVLIDGRDPSAPFFGAQEWAAIPFPLDDLSSVELVRGPSAALYGANASSGILNMISREPRFSRGGVARITVGQLGTSNLDFRWAGALGNDWYVKAVGGVRNSGDFSVSRRGAAEYSVPCAPGTSGDCLPQEAVAPARVNDDLITFGGLRLDHYLNGGQLLTMEGGLADVAGPIVQSGIGRVQVTDVSRPWARVAFTADRYSLFAAYSGRHAPGQLSLAAGTNSALDTRRVQVEGQTHWSFDDDRVRLVAGGSLGFDHIDSFDKSRGTQSVVFEPIDANREAAFGQVDWNVTDRIKLVVAGRGDASSLHDFQFSPKASVVVTPVANHSLRLTYNEAFQVANYSELFLQVDAAPPADLSALNAYCAPFGVDCGFGSTRVLAVGNEDLDLEQIATWELGYKGVLADRAFVTLDYYRSEASNFITDLLPQLGTSLGRVNPSYGAWQAPAGLPAPVAAGIRAAVPTLTNNHDGSNILAVVSYTNFGSVRTQGVDASVNYFFPAGWRASAAYSWFDFTIEDQLPGFDSLLLPNAPEHSASLGLGYDRARLTTDVNVRLVSAFRWAVGSFQGLVEAYQVVDLTALYDLTPEVAVGLNVANLFDDRHWEAFGGDLLRRRALLSLQYKW